MTLEERITRLEDIESIRSLQAKYLVRKLRRDGARLGNEYHFLMPYNIHFRFDEKLVKEMLSMDASCWTFWYMNFSII